LSKKVIIYSSSTFFVKSVKSYQGKQPLDFVRRAQNGAKSVGNSTCILTIQPASSNWGQEV